MLPEAVPAHRWTQPRREQDGINRSTCVAPFTGRFRLIYYHCRFRKNVSLVDRVFYNSHLSAWKSILHNSTDPHRWTSSLETISSTFRTRKKLGRLGLCMGKINIRVSIHKSPRPCPVTFYTNSAHLNLTRCRDSYVPVLIFHLFYLSPDCLTVIHSLRTPS